MIYGVVSIKILNFVDVESFSRNIEGFIFLFLFFLRLPVYPIFNLTNSISTFDCSPLNSSTSLYKVKFLEALLFTFSFQFSTLLFVLRLLDKTLSCTFHDSLYICLFSIYRLASNHRYMYYKNNLKLVQNLKHNFFSIHYIQIQHLQLEHKLRLEV